MKLRRSIILLGLVAVLGLAAAGTASANPAWKFNGTELSGKETIVGAATSSSLTFSGVTTTCTHFLYNMKISNSGGKGTGEITELPLYECSDNNKNCSVAGIEGEKFPWHDHLSTIGSSDYLIIEGVYVTIEYTGGLCAIAGEQLVKGSAGGLIENSTEKANFNPTTFTTTGTSLKVGSASAEWKGEFPTEAFETHREQKLEG
jgi:hypothetical protein